MDAEGILIETRMDLAARPTGLLGKRGSSIRSGQDETGLPPAL
jgi:hypothetical protein